MMAWAWVARGRGWHPVGAVTKPQLGQMLSMQGQISLILIWHRILMGHRMMSHSSTTRMHQAALIPSGAYLSHVKNQWTWSVVIAAMNVQPLEQAVPQWK